MFVSRLSILTVPLFTFVSALPSPSLDTSAYAASSIISRDVVVIGGGASGTYAAIGLKDKGKSVAVVEAQGVLGGHTNTYIDSTTKTPIDYGVVEYDNTSIVTAFFGRFEIPLVSTLNAAAPSLTSYYVDFRTGKNDTSYIPANPTTAFGAYAGQLAKYPFLNTPGWQLPDPVPADLLIPFGDFVTKYNLQGAVFTINEYSQGFGDLLSIPTLYVLKYFSEAVLAGSQAGYLTTANHDNGELYQKAQAELGSSVFINSKVIATDRSTSSVKVAILTPQGPKLILASKLVISIPPLLSNLAGFDLSNSEYNLFAQFLNGAYYTALLTDTGIPDNIQITAVGANTQYNLPTVPGLYGIESTAVPGIKNALYGGPSSLPDASVKAAILSSIQFLQTAGTIPSSKDSPTFVAYNSHTPYELRVSAEAVAGGFYNNLTALQGQKNTWWTGAAFDKHDSGDLWAFTEGLLSGIVA